MGAIFHVPVARAGDPAELPRPVTALAARAGAELRDAIPAQPGTILVGAERAGLPAEVLAAADAVAHIPIRTESLNAAMAATVALYEFSRVQPA
jgi:TrmH family RNA methyltransferase